MNDQSNSERNNLNSSGTSQSHIVLFKIALDMKEAGLPDSFIENTVRAALDFEGISDLMKLWRDEPDQQEKNEIIADIQDMLDACLQKEKIEEFYVKFNDLDTIARHIRYFKDSLLSVVNERGGISRLSKLTGIPQPSLSRFFNSNSMPQRATLLKIANALELSEVKMDALRFHKQNHANDGRVNF